jgi:hypothetical protein
LPPGPRPHFRNFRDSSCTSWPMWTARAPGTAPSRRDDERSGRIEGKHLLVLSHDQRRMVHVNVKAHPTTAWTAQERHRGTSASVCHPAARFAAPVVMRSDTAALARPSLGHHAAVAASSKTACPPHSLDATSRSTGTGTQQLRHGYHRSVSVIGPGKVRYSSKRMMLSDQNGQEHFSTSGPGV